MKVNMKTKIIRAVRENSYSISDILLYDIIEYITINPTKVLWWFADEITTKAVLSAKIKIICDVFDWFGFSEQSDKNIKKIWKLLNIK